MGTDFTQDVVLHFLQSSGGSVKNSDLLVHFRHFIRDHADRDRNRELFKKFVNSVATVQQIDGVSHVVLRKKYRGHVPGSADAGPGGPPRPPAGKQPEPSAEGQPRQKPQRTTPAPPGVTAGKTILPAAGIVLTTPTTTTNNNNVETNFNLKRKQQQVSGAPDVSGRPAAAQVKTPSRSEPPARDRGSEVGQREVSFGPPPGTAPVVPAVRPHGETRQQVPVPETLRGREPSLQAEAGLHQQPSLHHISAEPQVATRRIRHRQSYKTAVSYDEDEEEEEDVPVRRGSAGGAWPLGAPLGDMGRAISASSPCIIDIPTLPTVISSSASDKKLPSIYIQDVEGVTLPPGGSDWSSEPGVGLRGQWAGPGPGPEPGSVLDVSARRSLPSEAERYTAPPGGAKDAAPHQDIHMDRRYSQPAGVQLEPRQGPDQGQRWWLSSSQGNIFSLSSNAGLSSSNRSSDSPRGSGWNSSCEDLQARAASTRKTRGGTEIQEVLQRAQGMKVTSVTHGGGRQTAAPWYRSTGHLHDDQEPTFHHSADNLHDNRDSTVRWLPRHLSTGDLYDDHEEAESSEGSTSSPMLRPAVARRLTSQMRSRMCRSMGADINQLLQEEATGGGGGGSEAARLNRLHMLSSSLSLRYNLSSSSLSSCSSIADLVEGADGKEGRRSLPSASSSAAHHEGSSRQSLVPLEPREHAWLVKGAAGAWPDIYSLFREDPSLLNKQDFISGFTVLHWIAKHGDHRVLNTLWYGVQKAGLSFDINARSTCGHTPLHIAAIHGKKNMMHLLVSKFNANVRLRDTAGKKPWQYLSHALPNEVFQLLGAPSWAAGKGVGRAESSWKQEQQQQQQQQQRRRRHHLSFASSGERPLTISGTTRVKRSSSIAAFLKHKSLLNFHGHHLDRKNLN